jgi:hypothetical protein
LLYSCRARLERRPASAIFGFVLAACIFVAWVTPTFSHVHDFFATAPFIALFLYVPVMLASAGYYLWAGVALAVPPVCDGLCLAYFGASGELQKVNALLFIAIMNFLYYQVLTWSDPL